jgi:hypothetical protein
MAKIDLYVTKPCFFHHFAFKLAYAAVVWFCPFANLAAVVDIFGASGVIVETIINEERARFILGKGNSIF